MADAYAATLGAADQAVARPNDVGRVAMVVCDDVVESLRRMRATTVLPVERTFLILP